MKMLCDIDHRGGVLLSELGENPLTFNYVSHSYQEMHAFQACFHMLSMRSKQNNLGHKRTHVIIPSYHFF